MKKVGRVFHILLMKISFNLNFVFFAAFQMKTYAYYLFWSLYEMPRDTNPLHQINNFIGESMTKSSFKNIIRSENTFMRSKISAFSTAGMFWN